MRVHLNGTFGYGTPRVYYGPGDVEVPDGLARALGLTALPTPDEGAHETIVWAEPGAVVGAELASLLEKSGYKYPDAIRAASDDALLAIDGVGRATLKKLRDAYGSAD